MFEQVGDVHGTVLKIRHGFSRFFFLNVIVFRPFFGGECGHESSTMVTVERKICSPRVRHSSNNLFINVTPLPLRLWRFLLFAPENMILHEYVDVSNKFPQKTVFDGDNLRNSATFSHDITCDLPHNTNFQRRDKLLEMFSRLKFSAVNFARKSLPIYLATRTNPNESSNHVRVKLNLCSNSRRSNV